MIDYAVLGVAIFGGVVWAVRLEGRVVTQEQLAEDHEQYTQERHQDLKERLQRIEHKLDRLSGYEQGDR